MPLATNRGRLWHNTPWASPTYGRTCPLDPKFDTELFYFMSWLISDAWAEPAPTAGAVGPDILSLLMMVGLFVIMWLFIIRPQMKRAKEHRKMVESLAKGDEVATTGGLVGRIVRLDDNFAMLEVATGVELRVQRNAISSMLPKGTLKAT